MKGKHTLSVTTAYQGHPRNPSGTKPKSVRSTPKSVRISPNLSVQHPKSVRDKPQICPSKHKITYSNQIYKTLKTKEQKNKIIKKNNNQPWSIKKNSLGLLLQHQED